MRNSISKYRLHSNNVFERPEEDNPHEPKRVIFLSVEGAKTERQYFEHLNELIKNSRNTIFRIVVLGRKNDDGRSSPEYVIELLDEYMEVRDGGLFPESWMKRLEDKYSPEVIKRLINTPEDVPHTIKRAIYDELLSEGVNLQYRRYLKDVGNNENDIFAAVIDRDGGEGGRTRETLEACIRESKESGYRIYLTNPCFEFWLLLHLCDVKTEYADQLKELLENQVISAKHTFVSREVSFRTHHTKNISRKKFIEEYFPRIPQAIEHAKDFATELNAIMDNLGTNLPELLHELGF